MPKKFIRITFDGKTAHIGWIDWLMIKERFNLKWAVRYGTYTKLNLPCPLCTKYYYEDDDLKCRGCTLRKFECFDGRLGCAMFIYHMVDNCPNLGGNGHIHFGIEGLRWKNRHEKEIRKFVRKVYNKMQEIELNQ